MKNQYFKWTVIALFFLTCSLSSFSDDETKQEEIDVVLKLKTLQLCYFELARLFDISVVAGYQEYPIPDWLIRHDSKKRDEYYEVSMKIFEKKNPARANRLDTCRFCFHFDSIKYLYQWEDKPSTDSLYLLLSDELLGDPFNKNLLIGYLGNKYDYVLISIGPDQKPDILGFYQNVKGEYIIPSKTESINDFEKIVSLSKHFFVDDNWRSDRNHTITLDINTIYDPTNGLISSGDVIFHKRENGNFMMDYNKYEVFTIQDVTFKNLDIYLKE